MKSADIAFIGAGKMAEALVGGIVGSGVFPPRRIVMSDVDPLRLAEMGKKYGVACAPDNASAAAAARCVLFAVKPQNMERVLGDASRARGGQTLYVSIAAGIRISFISSFLGVKGGVFRVMPNLPAFVGAGASVACGSGGEEDFETVKKVFGSVGIVEFVPEELMDAFTALSGSGPGFVAAFAESLVSAAEKTGICGETARRFAVQTLFGASKMMAANGISPRALRERVSSPGGTTVAGLAALESSGFAAAVENALTAAESRSRELSASGRTEGKK